MTIRTHAEAAAEQVFSVVGDLADDQRTRIRQYIETEMINLVRIEHSNCAKVAAVCCSADRNLAHKISAEIERETTALIANLSGMR